MPPLVASRESTYDCHGQVGSELLQRVAGLEGAVVELQSGRDKVPTLSKHALWWATSYTVSG